MKKDSLHQMDIPFQGHYYMLEDKGMYHCRNCKQELFRSEQKFHSGSGWPSFDGAQTNALSIEEGGGRGRKVSCGQCGRFLGQMVKGEGFTEADMRFDINSSALIFKPD